MLSAYGEAELNCDGPDGTGCRAPIERQSGLHADCGEMHHTASTARLARAELTRMARNEGWKKRGSLWLCPSCASIHTPHTRAAQ